MLSLDASPGLRTAAFALAFGLLLAPAARPAPSSSRLQGEADAVLQSILRLEPGLPNPNRVPVAAGTGPLSIFRAVEITLCNNPALQTQRENIRRMALEFQNTRHDFQPRWHTGVAANGSGSTLAFNGDRSSTHFFAASPTIGVTQRFLFGGEINLDAGTSLSAGNDQDLSLSPSAAISLRLPLLRGFGIDVNTENLVQRKRNLLYALRALKLQEEELALRTIESHLDLLSCRERIRAQQKRKEAADQLYRRASTFFGLGQSSELELVQAEQQSLRADRDLKATETEYANRLDDYKVLLNFPVGSKLELQDYRPPLIELPLDADSILRVALVKRVDLLTIADVIEDKRRALKLADKAFKPDLDLVGRAATANNAGSSMAGLSQDYSVGIEFSVPLDRDPENLNLLGAYQDLQQAERSLRVAQEGIESGARGGLRVLQNVEETLKNEDRIIASAERRLRLAEIQFEAGIVSSREVVDAQNDLLGEQDYRLDLFQKRFVGILRLRSVVGAFDPQNPLPKSL